MCLDGVVYGVCAIVCFVCLVRGCVWRECMICKGICCVWYVGVFVYVGVNGCGFVYV